jgi:DNA polymerase-3 subunit epsilon
MALSLLSRWCSAPIDRHRWVVLDVETTGLDVRQDQVLSVAALGLHWRQGGAELVVADAFEADLRPHAARANHDNILLHGIGLGRQQQGGAGAAGAAGLAGSCAGGGVSCPV